MAIQCVFCSSNEGHVCAQCGQKILSMSKEQLKQAHMLAVEKGNTEKAEILESYMEEVFDNERNNPMARRSLGSRRSRGLRHEKKPVR